MSYILDTIKNKLKKSVLNKEVFSIKARDESPFVKDLLLNTKASKNDFYNYVSSFIIKKILFKFLLFISKNLINKKKNNKNFIIFFKFYNYLNFFFFNNKMYFYKKYFSRKKHEVLYLDKFALSKKQINLNQALIRLKEKKIAFFKKNIWTKNKKFRKKNILIFNKKFFKFYISNRFNSFIVDSLLPFIKTKKRKNLRFIKKKLFGLFYRKYYYLFLFKRHIFNTSKKRWYKPKLLSKKFAYRTYAKVFVNRKFFTKRRRKIWRQVYYSRKRRIFLRTLLMGFDSKVYNQYLFLKFKKNINVNKEIFSDYLLAFAGKLAIKYSTDKDFFNRFFTRRKRFRRFKNILYFFKWKPKEFHLQFCNKFKENKNIRKFLFSLLWFKFFSKKVLWKKKKFLRFFQLFFFRNFFFDKSFLFFNCLLKSNFFFNNQKRTRRLLRWKKRKLTFYSKIRRRRLLKKKFKIKLLRFFILLLLFKLMKKHKNPEKIFVFRNSYFMHNIKKIKLKILSSVLLGQGPLYFKNGHFLSLDETNSVYKKDLKIISLLKKK